MSRDKTQRGITLIALVITIIVMLILVAVTITIAINGGLFGMAKDAKADTEEELAKENVLSTGRVKIGDKWYDSMEDYVNGKPSENQKDDNAGGGSGTGHGGTYDATPKNKENGTLTANATYESGEYTATIPAGFKVSEKKEEQEIETGLVIQDVEGNEFVWIPVTYEETGNLDDHELDSGFLDVFYRSNWSKNKRGTKYDNKSNYTEPYSKGEGYPNEAGEYYEMMKSVQKNGGFYIGRYEAGSTEPRTKTSEDTTMVVKRDQYPYNWVGWGNDMNDIESDVEDDYYHTNLGHGAVYLSKHMYEEKDNVGVVSTLCYGVQWDAMLDFIKDESHEISSSNTWGNYNVSEWTVGRPEAQYYDSNSNKWNSISEEEGQQKSKGVYDSILLTTGASDSFVAKNIYDVAGNCVEWTMEASSTIRRVFRGGGYYDSGSSYPATSRVDYPPNGSSEKKSFRPTLYIKN